MKNVKDEISRPLGSREIQITKVCTVLPDTLYFLKNAFGQSLFDCVVLVFSISFVLVCLAANLVVPHYSPDGSGGMPQELPRFSMYVYVVKLQAKSLD